MRQQGLCLADAASLLCRPAGTLVGGNGSRIGRHIEAPESQQGTISAFRSLAPRPAGYPLAGPTAPR